MVQTKFLLIGGFLLITSACSPALTPTPADSSILPTDTSTATITVPTNSRTPSPSFTPTPAKSYFTLAKSSNCHKGPDKSYSVVLIIRSGEKVEVVGRNKDNTWWYISKKDSANCWIANESGTFDGEAALIPITSLRQATEVHIFPSPTKKKPIVRENNPIAATDTLIPPEPPTNTDAPLPTQPVATQPIVPPPDTPLPPDTPAPTDPPGATGIPPSTPPGTP